MKKLFLFLSVFVLFFALTACDDATVLDTINSVEDTVTSIEADITALEASIAALENATGVSPADITALNARITTINTELDLVKRVANVNRGYIDDLEAELALIQEEIDAIQENIDMLEVPVVSVDNWKELVNTQIVLMYSNDVHGRVNDDSFAGSIGYARIKNVIDEIRANYMYSYLVSAGDMFHGTTFATLEEGESFVEVMNSVGYDLMVPGNHDFDYGQDQLLVLEGLADFPLISSNIQYDADDSDMFEPYFIETFGDVEVGFFGITTPDTTYMTHPDNVIGLNFLDPVTQAQAMVTALEDEGVDIIVMLGHVGLDEASSITTEDIANAVDGIDVIIDGHSHSYLPAGYMVNGALIVSTGEYNKNFGILELTIEDGELIAYNNLLLNDSEVTALGFGADEAIQDAIDEITDAQDLILNEVIGQTAVELDGVRDNVRANETNLGKLIADSMIVVTDADIAITNGGGIRASIAVGDVTLGDVITVLPFGNIIVTVDLTGQEIVDTLEYGVSGLPGTSGKFPHVAGLTYTVDLNNAEGERVEDVMINGVAVNLTATYSVATNDFMAAGGDGYELLGAAAITGEYMGLHEALEAMFTVGVDIVVPVDVRVTIVAVIPE